MQSCLFVLILLAQTYTVDLFGSMFSTETKHAFIDGDVMIGGLVAIHDAGGVNSLLCGSNISLFGIQRLEAMRYAINQINKNDDILPGIKLGMEIRDSCGSETIALDESLQFVIDQVRVCNKTKKKSKPLFGVVGASMSLLTTAVASLLRLFKIPLVSYAATSTELTDKAKYSFLLRTVPVDSFQSHAMVDFMQNSLEWKSVFVLYSSGSYGEHGYNSFVAALGGSNVCLIDSKKISPGSSVADLRAVIREFHRTEPSVRAIVCYCEQPDARNIVQALNGEDLSEHFRMIGSDTWFLVKSNNSIMFSLHYNESDVRNFYENWYSRLSPENVPAVENPWFENFWNFACSNLPKENCKFPNSTFGLCRGSAILSTCQVDDKLPYTMDAVYSFAHAIHDMIQKRYNGNFELFKASPLINGGKFLEGYLKKVNFEGSVGQVKFPVKGFYDIHQYKSDVGLKLIGVWRSGRLVMNNDWEAVDKYGFGVSSCQQVCGRNGTKRVYTSKSCCWRCEACKKNEYLKDQDTCVKCSYGSRPSITKSSCEVIPLKHIGELWKIVITTLAVIGFLSTFTTIVVFLRHNTTPLVRASGREMTYVLLFGIMALYALPFLLLSYPNSFLCATARFNIGFCICLCYSALLIKTNRIARIFTGRQDLLFLTPHWQVLLTLLLLAPQACISVVGLTHISNKETVYYSESEAYGIVSCNTDTPDIYATFTYNIILILVTTYYAFRTRKVPSNFNEARYIGFVMYTTVVIWLAFMPVFVGTSAEYKTVAVMLDLIINATTLLVGLFGMKLYIIILRPTKNSKGNSKIRTVTFITDQSDLSNGAVLFDNDQYYSSIRFHKASPEPNGATAKSLVDENANTATPIQ